MTRLGVTTSLDPWDIAALRCGVPAILLLPVLIGRGLAHDRLGWSGLGIAVAGAGAPYVLVASLGLRLAPAADQVVLNPGSIPLFVALLAMTVSPKRICGRRSLGLALIALGPLVIMLWHAIGGGVSHILADVLCLLAALLWACFTIVIWQAQLDPLHAASIVAVGSSVFYLPIYAVVRGFCLEQMPISDVVLQAVFQGVLVSTIAILCYGRSVVILGASAGALSGALVPVMSAAVAIPLLGEWPSEADYLALTLISIGVWLASGGPLPR